MDSPGWKTRKDLPLDKSPASLSLTKRMRIKNRELSEKACMVLLESRDERTTLEDRERVAVALFQLPPEQREVIVLKIWEGFTFKEISRILDIPLGHVR